MFRIEKVVKRLWLGRVRATCFTLFMVTLAACGRPMTENEITFAHAFYGDQISVNPIRFHDGYWAGSISYFRPARPRLSCTERLFPPSEGAQVTVAPAAGVVFNQVYFRDDLYRSDYMPDLPEQVDLMDTMLLVHELVHVWQWQNRDRTGYHPLKGASEHAGNPDPYLFDTETQAEFLGHGYEQQGAIVEEYMCCYLLDPQAPRTKRLRNMISAEIPVENLEASFNPARVRIPWGKAETRNICR